MKKTSLKEFEDLQSMLPKFKRSPRQLNQVFESDSEILALSKKTFLAVSTDGLDEEFESGLYRDPETLGWMSVVMSLSDVACSGADPLGVVIAVNWKKKMSLNFQRKFFRGARDCLNAHRTFLLGGDSGHSSHFSVVSTAMALGQQPAIQRSSIKPGDLLVALSPLGLGAAYAYSFLMKSSAVPEKKLRPVIPFQKIKIVKKYCHMIIDNSDGIMNTLAILSDLNGIGFDLQISEKFFHPLAVKFCKTKKIPVSSLLWAELGGYEMIASVQPKHLKKFLQLHPEGKVFAVAIPKKNQKIDLFYFQKSQLSYLERMKKSIQLCS
ncbi:MAG: AIR synthase related protein [Pseudobdellovibrionaceae bacterium]